MPGWNIELFGWLNAAVQPSATARFVAEALAGGPAFLAPVLLAGLWIWGRPAARGGLIATGIGLFVGQLANWTLGHVWDDPRPFVVGVGHTWIVHAADNGLPSDHTTLGLALGLGLVLTRAAPRWGVLACAVGLAAGWARIYLGVHFPLDIVAAVPTALFAALIARALRPPIEHFVAPHVDAVGRFVCWRLRLRRPAR